MCGRYTYFSSDEIVKDYDLLPEESKQLALELRVPDNYNVAPGQLMPVIIRGKQENIPVLMTWGLIPSWIKSEKDALKLINARKEGLFEKPMWKRLVGSQRCVVPARGFYEWEKQADGKQPFYITPTEGKVLSFAGLWDEWVNDNGEKVQTYTIITTTPNKEMSEVHNRMPVILNKEQASVWLSPLELSRAQVDDLLQPAQDGTLRINKVSRDVNNSQNNKLELIYPLPNKENTKQSKNDDHYVPRLHLKEFYGRDNKLWVYDRLYDSYTQKSAGAIAYIPNYYTTDTVDQKDSRDVEHMFSKVESVAKPLLDKLAHSSPLTRDDRGNLSMYFALQHLRVPATEKQLTEATILAYKGVHDAFINIMTENKQAFEHTYRDLMANIKTEDRITKDEFRKIITDKGYELNVEVPRSYNLFNSLEMAEEIANALYIMDWHVLTAPKGHAFITSDNPFTILGDAVLARGAFKHYPINKTMGLLIGHSNGAYLGYENATVKEVRMFNDAIAFYSERYVFSHSDRLLRNIVNRLQLNKLKLESRMDVEVIEDGDINDGKIVTLKSKKTYSKK